ncbi:tetratricopeptide repeat protein [Novosphingobium tardum]|uniref:Tetratricopeptide repeat protein n=1 Tax=Novosphingobium tardum TaxID=1538021 RepID=A0ABV8RPP7_9SPHN
MKTTIPLALALLLAGCGADPQTRVDRAEKAMAAHDHRAAQIDLAAVLADDPGNARALLLSARNALAQGDGDGARAALNKIPQVSRPRDWSLLAAEAALLREEPDEALQFVASQSSAEALRLRALAQAVTGDDEAAAQTFAAGLGAPGDKARLYADYARFRLRSGDTGGARQMADRALALAPATLDSLLADAQVATEQGDLARALRSYDKAAAGYPGNLAAMTGRAGVLGDLGRTAEMDAAIAQIAALAPDSPQVAYLRARSAAARKDWAKVRDILQPGEATLASRPDALLLYAEAMLGLDQSEQARALLAPLARREPGNRIAALLLARAQFDGGDPKAAVQTLSPLASRPEAAPEVLTLMARAAQAAQDPRAGEFAARAKSPTPQALAAELARGDSALKAGNWQAASTAYERILAVTDGRNVLVLNNLAFAQGKLGNGKRGLTYALRALKLAPANPAVMDTAGWLMVETESDRSQGTALLREAAAKAPGNAAIAAHLAQAEKG